MTRRRDATVRQCMEASARAGSRGERMNKLESELFDLEECLVRNDDMADGNTYSTIIGIANEVSELESENTKLRELTKEMFYSLLNVAGGRRTMTAQEAQNLMNRMRKLGIEV